jgi:hypothetical protein
MKIEILNKRTHSGSRTPLLRSYIGMEGIPLSSRIEKSEQKSSLSIPFFNRPISNKTFKLSPFFWDGKNFPKKKKILQNVHDYLIVEREDEEMVPCENETAIVARALHFFNLEGFLRKTSDGYLFLKVDDKLIHKLYPLLKHHGATKPPYFHHIDRVGAHIPVMTREETENLPSKVSEMGTTYPFTITGCHEMVPQEWDGIKKAWVLTIDSPELQELREKYHLSPSLGANPFTLTIAIKEGQTLKSQEAHFRINPAVHYG